MPYPDSFEAIVPGTWTGGLKASLLSKGNHASANTDYDKMAASLLPALRAERVSSTYRLSVPISFNYNVCVKNISSGNGECTVSRHTKRLSSSNMPCKSTGFWQRRAKLAWHKKRTSPNSSLCYFRRYVCVLSRRLPSKKIKTVLVWWKTWVYFILMDPPIRAQYIIRPPNTVHV